MHLTQVSLNQAGQDATNANWSNFIGFSAGYGYRTSYSNFIGMSAGYETSGSSTQISLVCKLVIKQQMHLTQIGSVCWAGATNANDSNFFGFNAGQVAKNAYWSNFIGREAGSGQMLMFQISLGECWAEATNAYTSNFIGQQAGYQATGAYASNFFGGAGYEGNASYSNFIGHDTGRNATEARNSNFLGECW
jgi:hypothetical protein